MTTELSALVMGRRIGPVATRFESGFVRRFAAATNDASARVSDGNVVPPIAAVAQLWDAQESSRDQLVPLEFQRRAAGGVHGEHDVVLHRPMAPGEQLQTWVEGFGARPAGPNSLVTLRYLSVDADEAVVAEQWWTTVWLGVTWASVGASPPGHAFPADARDRDIGTWSTDIDDEMAHRYAEASGDWSPHHFDAEAARVSGSDRVFLHGLCTMALCARGVVELAAGGDHERVRRIAVRFARPAFLGERLDVRVFDAGPLGLAFEAECAGVTVITNGRAELR